MRLMNQYMKIDYKFNKKKWLIGKDLMTGCGILITNFFKI
jgi:hypothetical protein